MAAHSSVLAWRLPGTGNLAGCRLWGRTESDTTEATSQRQHEKDRRSLQLPLQRRLGRASNQEPPGLIGGSPGVTVH